MISNHYQTERCKREEFINKYFHDEGNIIDGFIVDKGHKDGAEVHSLTDTGLIIINNLQTGKMITKLIAKPKQIMRYYEMSNREKPPEYKYVLEIAAWHESLCLNYM